MVSARRRFWLVVLVGVCPWTFVSVRGAWTVFTSVGFFDLSLPPNVVLVHDYLFVYTRGLPEFILAWPIGIVVYAAALGSAALGLVGREDRRLTAGLLVLVGLTQLSFAWGFMRLSTRRGYVAVPLVTLLTFTLVWWVYWPDVRQMVFSAGR